MCGVTLANCKNESRPLKAFAGHQNYLEIMACAALNLNKLKYLNFTDSIYSKLMKPYILGLRELQEHLGPQLTCSSAGVTFSMKDPVFWSVSQAMTASWFMSSS